MFLSRLTCRLTVFIFIAAAIFTLTLLNLDSQTYIFIIRKSDSKVPSEGQNRLSSISQGLPFSHNASSASASASQLLDNSNTSTINAVPPSLNASSVALPEPLPPSPPAPPPAPPLFPSAPSLRLLDNGNSCWMTNDVSGNDGWGSQWQHISAAIVIAAQMNFNFAYTPMTKLDHLPNPFDREKMHEMEVFAGFSSFRLITDISSDIPRHSISDVHQAVCSGPVLYTLMSPKGILDHHADWWVSQRNVLRTVYFSTPKPDLSNIFPANRTNVVAFQRRFNKLWDTRCSFLPNEYYIGVMKTVRAKYPNSAFHVLSQSNMMQPFPNKNCNNYNELSDEQFEDFEVFGDTSVHLDFSVQMAVHMMIMSDVLITSQSSFSYAASLYSVHQVYSIQFWHAALSGWHSCSYSYDQAVATCS
jgi:hypothetical protein